MPFDVCEYFIIDEKEKSLKKNESEKASFCIFHHGWNSFFHNIYSYEWSRSPQRTHVKSESC